jgi:glutamate 5-kinase
MKKFNFSEAEKIVIKLGSSIVTNDGDGLDEKCLSSLIKQISILNSQNKKVILVSSGAIAAGLRKLGVKRRPKVLSELQSAAAVGQMDLVRVYEELFSDNNLISAQILLTHSDLSDRKRYLNARSTIFNLIKNNVIPVINENDTVASEEIRFGDNDSLAAMVANLIEADLLVLLTDQDGLFSSDPRDDNNAKLIRHSYVDDKNLDDLASGTKSTIGTGGMATKILAARRAALSGAHTIIASGKRNNILVDLSNDEDIGTFLQSREIKLVARKKWLADNLKSNGKIYIDQGAEKALIHKGKSLLAVGVTKVIGTFDRGEVIQCVNESGHEILKGLVNYNSEEVKKIIGVSSDKIESILGYVNESSLIHRDNMIIIPTVRKEND